MTGGALRSGAPSAPWARLAPCLLFAATLLAYATSLDGEFLQDDLVVIAQNRLVLDASHLPEIFGSSYREGTPGSPQDYLYRPVTIASYALTAALWGLDPWAFHAVNLLLHMIAVLLLYRLLLRLFGAFETALIASLLFAVHPAISEAVTNCSGRAELLAAMWGLLGWLVLLRQPPEGRSPRNLVLASLLFFVAFLSKESALTLVALVPLGDAVLRIRKRERASLLDGVREVVADRGFRRTSGALLAVAIVYLGVRAAVLGGLSLPREEIPFLDNPSATVSGGARILTALSVIGRYLGLLAFPLHLSADYSHAEIPIAHGLADPWIALAGGGLLAAIWALGARVRPPRAIAFGILFFWVALSIASNLPFPVGTIMAERLLYLPAVGFCLVVSRVFARIPATRARFAALFVVTILFALRTADRGLDWRDNPRFAAANARTSPRSAKSRYNFGNVLLEQAQENGRKGRGEEAHDGFLRSLEEFRIAVEIYPEYTKAWLNRGAAALDLRDFEEAHAAFLRAAELEPGWDAPWYNLGRLRMLEGKPAQAVSAFEEAQRRSTNPLRAGLIFEEMGKARLAAGDRDGAKRAFEEAFARNPDSPDLLVLMARIRASEGRLEEARRLLGRALRLAPGHPEAREFARQLEGGR